VVNELSGQSTRLIDPKDDAEELRFMVDIAASLGKYSAGERGGFDAG
jgi:hypothetical protein